MLNERSYMNAKNIMVKRTVKTTNVIIAINIAIFLLELIFQNFFNTNFLSDTFALSKGGIASGFYWSFLTYSFLHANFWHLALNMFILYFIGENLEFITNKKKFLIIYLCSGICGGLLWYLTDLLRAGSPFLVGASASVIGVFTAFCMLHPDRKITFLLFFIIPIDVRPKIILMIITGFELFGLLFFEIAPYSKLSDIAYSAHLGGIFSALILSRFLEGGFKKINLRRASDFMFSVNIRSEAELKAETDRILDKMNDMGFASLTDEEKATLKTANEKLK